MHERVACCLASASILRLTRVPRSETRLRPRGAFHEAGSCVFLAFCLSEQQDRLLAKRLQRFAFAWRTSCRCEQERAFLPAIITKPNDLAAIVNGVRAGEHPI